MWDERKNSFFSLMKWEAGAFAGQVDTAIQRIDQAETPVPKFRGGKTHFDTDSSTLHQEQNSNYHNSSKIAISRRLGLKIKDHDTSRHHGTRHEVFMGCFHMGRIGRIGVQIVLVGEFHVEHC